MQSICEMSQVDTKLIFDSPVLNFVSLLRRGIQIENLQAVCILILCIREYMVLCSYFAEVRWKDPL